MQITFKTVDAHPHGDTGHSNEAILVRGSWDDWGKYRTKFYLIIFDREGVRHDIGSVKIGQVGLKPSKVVAIGQRAPTLPDTFHSLNDNFFSLGQDATYYEALQAFEEQTRVDILKALKDCAYDLPRFASVEKEYVVGESLLRSVSRPNVIGKFHRLTRGDAELTPFHFDFVFEPSMSLTPGPVLEFRVKPHQNPPTNVHVVIGRNSSGKTRFLQALARSIVDPEGKHDVGSLVIHNDDNENWDFASFVYVSFSLFDDFVLPPVKASKIRAAQVSLQDENAVADKSGKPTKAGVDTFTKSLAVCRRGPRCDRWKAAIYALESDPLFEEANFVSLLDVPEKFWKASAAKSFKRLSSGHAAVLLTITKLVELVDEHTLVLLDEPEGHLHPPLLAAMIRSLSDLLTKRNGVAIIATHSPVILQEVPSSCVWKLRRSGSISVAERPDLETFGENVGILTSEVFGLEVTRSGFHTLITDAVKATQGNYDEVLATFGGNLGAEGRAIARGLSATYTAEDDNI